MTATLLGRTEWEGKRDDIGHRDYWITWLVQSDPADGPETVLNCPGLPVVGSPWIYGNDSDVWAMCHPEVDVQMVVKTGEKQQFFKVKNYFTTKPLRRCSLNPIDNPILEPTDLTGNFFKYTQEASFDANGAYLQNSSYEQITGPQAERDFNRPTFVWTKNYTSLDLLTISQFLDTVHNAPLYGLPTYTIKFSNCSWTRLLYGLCIPYFRVTMEFEVKYDYNALLGTFEGWERNIPDLGTRVLGQGGNPNNPGNFNLGTDNIGNVSGLFPLDGAGNAATSNTITTVPGLRQRYYFQGVLIYPANNLLLLGIPITLNSFF